jgi:hypothetical protein
MNRFDNFDHAERGAIFKALYAHIETLKKLINSEYAKTQEDLIDEWKEELAVSEKLKESVYGS